MASHHSRKALPAIASARRITSAFGLAKERYAEIGVEVEDALDALSHVPLSLQCWQGDDVTGFEGRGSELGGGLAVTGNYRGKARTPDELRADLELAFSLIPGRQRVNLHASYGEFGGRKIDRDEVAPEHFRNWIAWAKTRGLGLDFNPTFFGHPQAAEGLTLTHPNSAVRSFWVQHGIRSREIGAAMGKSLGTPCVTNLWIPDGFKDTPADRLAPRERLTESLDTIFAKSYPARWQLDAVEPKLFGLGSESYVAGSHEFYLGYAITRKKLLCLDSGHYHPTESIADKISSVLAYVPELLLHLSRGVRWDSDHVVTFSDDLQAIVREVVVHGFLNRVHLGLDYFDASINRIAAWVIGTRNVQRALLAALLEPTDALRQLERQGDFTARLVLQEQIKALPLSAVWDHYCEKANVPLESGWFAEIRAYEKRVLANRS